MYGFLKINPVVGLATKASNETYLLNGGKKYPTLAITQLHKLADGAILYCIRTIAETVYCRIQQRTGSDLNLDSTEISLWADSLLRSG